MLTDGARAILLELTENAATIDALFAWVRREGWMATVELGWPQEEDTAYQAHIQRPAGRQRRNIGNGSAPTGYDALGMAIVCTVAGDRLCDECYGQGRFREDACPQCHGSGLGLRGEEA